MEGCLCCFTSDDSTCKTTLCQHHLSGFGTVFINTGLYDGRYNVYADLEAEAAYLKLNDSGVYLLQLQAAFAKLQVLIDIFH